MTNQLMKLSDLGMLLDYSDVRSIESWCKKNNIPIIPAGKQKYVLSSFVDEYFKNFVIKKVSGVDTVSAETAKKTGNENVIRTHSKASQTFLENVKSK